MNVKHGGRSWSLAACLAWASLSSWGQNLPTGLWVTYDDDGRTAQAVVKISQAGPHLVGHIVEVLDPQAAPDAKCDRCTDERKDKPFKGLQIISHVNPAPQGQVWKQGVILDPDEGKEYRLEIEWVPGATEMKLRGHWGPFWRTQVWKRSP
jgi:uncharacterized protein (DUF2147 family)